MCAEVELKSGYTMASLHDLFMAGFEIRPEDIGSVKDWNSCFCSVDPEPVLKRNFVKYHIDEIWGNYVLESDWNPDAT